MANELNLTGSLQYGDTEGTAEILAVVDKLASVATKKAIRNKVSVGTTEEAVPLSECTSPGWCILINRDTTNYIEVKVATGGAIFAKMLAGEFCLLRLGSGAQAPFWQANTAACQGEVLLCQT